MPQYKFNSIYLHLDELCDKVDRLDQFTMDNIGLRAKDLSKTFDDILKVRPCFFMARWKVFDALWSVPARMVGRYSTCLSYIDA